MAALLEEVFSDTDMAKLEKGTILPPKNSKLYKHLVDDSFPRHKTNVSNKLPWNPWQLLSQH